jgi:hypothetical protein
VLVALGIQHAMRISHIVIFYLPDSTILFPHFLTNGTILETVTEHEMCVLIFLTIIFETYLILRINEQNMESIINEIHSVAFSIKMWSIIRNFKKKIR